MADQAASAIPRATILAVDDDTSILQLMGSVLESAGYNVLLADGGWSAVQTFQNAAERIHLLLTDVIMPDLTGPVLAARLRERQPDLRVLFISGFHDADLVQRFIARNQYKLLPKPFTVEGLLRVVQDTLRTDA